MWLIFSLITLILYGLWGFFPKVATQYLEPKQIIFYEFIGIASVVAVLFFSQHGKLTYHPKGFLFSLLTGISGLVGTLFFLYALKSGKASVVILMTSLYPIISITLAYLFLKEPMTTKQIIGAGFAIIAMVLFAI